MMNTVLLPLPPLPANIPWRHLVSGLVGFCTQSEPELILIEYMDIGDLQMYLQAKAENDPGGKGLPEHETFVISEHIANGCVHLASNGIVHRDLATRNVLIGSGPVLIYFGYFSVTSRTLMGCTDPRRRGCLKHSRQCPLGVGSKLPHLC